MTELLKDYPKAAEIIRTWFLNKMLDGLNDDNLPEGFKEYVRKQGIDYNKISDIIESNPRSLVDVFDENEIYIDTTHVDGSFWWAVNSSVYQEKYPTRTEAEKAAIAEAFKLLNEKA